MCVCALCHQRKNNAAHHRYMPTGKITKHDNDKTSLDNGGSCHMARGTGYHPAMRSITQSNICRKVYSNYTHTVVRCKNVDGTFYDLDMKKELSKAPDWMVRAMKTEKRQKCNTCSAYAPKWKTEFTNQPLPQGPEVSYGIPFRWSAARLLAADMRAMVCGSRLPNATCDSLLLKLGEWTPENFATKYFSEALPDLVAQDIRPPPLSGYPASILKAIRDATASVEGGDNAEDMFLWSGRDAPGWVACTQSNNTCYGTISKANWYDRERRGATCNRVFAEQVLTIHDCIE